LMRPRIAPGFRLTTGSLSVIATMRACTDRLCARALGAHSGRLCHALAEGSDTSVAALRNLGPNADPALLLCP
jgi:hypothetical protein